MDKVRKVYFDPLVKTKPKVRELLQDLPLGSAHPFSPEKILLCKTENGIKEIDTSDCTDAYFFQAQDLGEMGELLQQRMDCHRSKLTDFEDFQIMQAPAATFEVPIVSDKITILSFSKVQPTYYDLCFADAACNTTCFSKTKTLPGITHSGDIRLGGELLQHASVHASTLPETEVCVFISGYRYTHINKFLGTHPALLVADHTAKILYLIPVPLDAATIGEATICCPLVIKPQGDLLVCSILTAATIDYNKMCGTSSLLSDAFPEAIRRADFTIAAPSTASQQERSQSPESLQPTLPSSLSEQDQPVFPSKSNALFLTNKSKMPPNLNLDEYQIIRYGSGLEFEKDGDDEPGTSQSETVVLPCIFGAILEGPMLLATGSVPSNVPFSKSKDLRAYYNSLQSVVIVVDERMTDNARNLATPHRINALFIVQAICATEPETDDDVWKTLNSVNINAATALAGPLSLVLVQVNDKFYFYRGLANAEYFDTAKLRFGADVSETVRSVDLEHIVFPHGRRICYLDNPKTVVRPSNGAAIPIQDIQNMFGGLSITQITQMQDDITGMICQLQVLLDQKELQGLSQKLVGELTNKLNQELVTDKAGYVKFWTEEFDADSEESVKEKERLLGDLRKRTRAMRKSLEPVISGLATMNTARTTSKRTHDLKKLARQVKIRANVENAKAMTFEKLSHYLETFAEEMGILVVNVHEGKYTRLLQSISQPRIDASDTCELDQRILHLDGLDAGLIIEQSQTHHSGPLQNQAGESHPILAVPNLNRSQPNGSMLAWVCWDEFVNLESPYQVRWIEKCNDEHVAALRIVMRDTLSSAVSSRDLNLHGGSPEAGHLMGALLMTTIAKLAALRTTTPPVAVKAEDTVTKLMRGLFGNLLTLAGSGARPTSMVWQLFGAESTFDVPTTPAQWTWYETVVAFCPYTGWQQQQIRRNLVRLLDKVLLRVVSKHEDVEKLKDSRATDMIYYCRLRNIQLAHSRTIITILAKMLTNDDIDTTAAAGRLLAHLPETLPRQSQSYTMMIAYLHHLRGGGQPHQAGNVTIARVHAKRSAAFADVKKKVEAACRKGDWPAAKKASGQLIKRHAKLAAHWKLDPEEVTLQNLNAYKNILALDESSTNPYAKQKFSQKVYSDAEKNRVPWRVGKKGWVTEEEPLDKDFVEEILHGKTSAAVVFESQDGEEPQIGGLTAEMVKDLETVAQFLTKDFIAAMKKSLTPEDVCELMHIPVPTMQLFTKLLQEDFEWATLGVRFKKVMLCLLKDRAGRAKSEPLKQLLKQPETNLLTA